MPIQANQVRLVLRQHPLTSGRQKSASPFVVIDGIGRDMTWGENLLPYWDARAVTMEIAVPNYAVRGIRTHVGRRRVTLPAGAGRELEYVAPPNEFAGAVIGAPGRTKTGGWFAAIVPMVIVVVVLGLVLTAAILSIVAVVSQR